MENKKQFKTITATFKLSFQDAKTNYEFNYDITIKRQLSGCFKYGDRSAHIIELNNKFYMLLDTRYDHITINKEGWIKYWLNWVKNNWNNEFNKNIKVINNSYNEEFIDIE